MNPNQQQPQQPFQPSTPPPAQYQQQTNVSGSLLPHKSSKVPLILAVLFALLFFCAAGFGLWAFGERADYKDNSDAKSAQAVEEALAVQKEELSQEFAEQEKEPYLTYNGPSTYGSFSFEYPRNWSVYLVESGNSTNLYTLFMHPKVINDVTRAENEQALTVEVVGSKYEDQISRLDNSISQGRLTAKAYRPQLVESVLGLRVSGEITNSLSGQRVYLPIRDRTLIISTESNNYGADFDRILSTLKFTP